MTEFIYMIANFKKKIFTQNDCKYLKELFGIYHTEYSKSSIMECVFFSIQAGLFLVIWGY